MFPQFRGKLSCFLNLHIADSFYNVVLAARRATSLQGALFYELERSVIILFIFSPVFFYLPPPQHLNIHEFSAMLRFYLERHVS
jgi:hypothetical protein